MNGASNTLSLALCAASLVLATVANGAAAAEPQLDEAKKVLAVDLSVPSSPAMVVLGMNGTEIQRPAFPRELVSSLLRGFDKDGKVKNALAIDVNPVALVSPGSLTGGEDYVSSRWMQLAARTTVSLAASQVENDNGASQLAAGIRVGLIDRADPGWYWEPMSRCVQRILAAVPMNPEKTTRISPEYRAALDKANAECTVDKLVADLWAKPALYAGYAQAWYSNPGFVKGSNASAKALWASFSVGLNPRSVEDARTGKQTEFPRALLQLYLARKLNDRVKNPSGEDNFVRENRTEFIARIRFGKAKWHSFIDGGISRVQTAGVATENVKRIGVGFEYQLRDDLWLVVANVRETGFAAGTRNLLSTGLRFGLPAEPQFPAPGATAPSPPGQ